MAMAVGHDPPAMLNAPTMKPFTTFGLFTITAMPLRLSGRLRSRAWSGFLLALMLAALLHPDSAAQAVSILQRDDPGQCTNEKQTEANRSPGTTTSAAVSNDSRPIQDNSLLVEEAYNQAVGVVQHV